MGKRAAKYTRDDYNGSPRAASIDPAAPGSYLDWKRLTFRALTYKLLVLAAEHVDRSRRMSMLQGLQALFHTSSFDSNPQAMGSTVGCTVTWSR
jgi:hypothetical protein